jgi:branched-chain amino acid transport system ATP-binding protein
VFALFPILKDRREQLAETLSGGEQEQLAIPRGLMSRPTLLLLDEPSLRIMSKLHAEIGRSTRSASRASLLLLVEQNVFEALHVSHRACLLRGEELLESDL